MRAPDGLRLPYAQVQPRQTCSSTADSKTADRSQIHAGLIQRWQSRPRPCRETSGLAAHSQPTRSPTRISPPDQRFLPDSSAKARCWLHPPRPRHTVPNAHLARRPARPPQVRSHRKTDIPPCARRSIQPSEWHWLRRWNPSRRARESRPNRAPLPQRNPRSQPPCGIPSTYPHWSSRSKRSQGQCLALKFQQFRNALLT